MKGKQDFYIIFLFLSSLIISIFFFWVCVNLTQKPLTISAQARGLLYLWTLLL